MNRKKRILFLILTVILCLSLAFTAVACKDTETGTEEETETKLFTNGDFSVTSGETYPLTPGSWTGAIGYSSAPSGSDNVIAGVIDTDESNYSRNRRTYGRIANPGKSFTTTDSDTTNLLMIYNKAKTFYKYTSSSISLTARHYYKLTFAVKTVDLSENTDNARNFGANVFVSGSAYAEYTSINTNGTWEYKELYIEAGTSSGSITVVAQLGAGTSSDTSALVSGYAYFDNFVLEDLTEVEEDETEFTQDDFNRISIGVEGSTTTAKYSALLGDTDMDYISGTTTPYSASRYTTVAGFGNGDNALSSSTYVEKGILDTAVSSTYRMSYGNKENLTITTPQTSNNTRVLYIQNKRATAYGYRNSVSYAIAAGEEKYYKISVMVRTDIPDAAQGASLKLTTGSGADNELAGFKITGINNSVWTEYSFFIEANQLRSRSIYLEMWLGEGGQNDTTTHVVGSAFFDCISFAETTKTEYDIAYADSNNTTLANTLQTDMANIKPIDASTFKNDLSSDNLPQNNTKTGVVDVESWDSSEFNNIDNPRSAIASNTNIIVINNFLPSTYSLSNIYRNTESAITKDDSIKVNKNSTYIVSFWVKTSGISSGSGLSATLKQFSNSDNLNITNIPAENYSSFFSSSSEFTAINTLDLTSYLSEGNNDYTEFAFYVQGNEINVAELALTFTLGSGDKYTSTSHLSGYAFISNITIEEIDYTEYSSASASTVLKKLSLLSSAASNEISSNGYFNFVSVGETNTLYDETTDRFENGSLKNVLGVPTGWTVSDSTALVDNNTTLTSGQAHAGVLDLSSKFATTSLGLDTSIISDISTVIPGYTAEKYPNVLFMQTNNLRELHYTSSNMSLTANSYYMVTVWARALGSSNNNMSILLTSTTNTEATSEQNFIGSATATWKPYIFYVETGYSSVSAKLELYAGISSSNASPSDSTVMFAAATYTSISEDVYNTSVSNKENASYNAYIQSWQVDTFDQTSSADSLSTPSGWTGALVDSDASSADDDLASGVFNKDTSDWGDLDIDADEDTTITDAIFNNSKTNIGSRVLVIYNKNNTAYGYSSSSISLTADTYYKISIWVLTYKLAETDSATISLKINNLTYTFGRQTTNTLTDNEKARQINTSSYTDGEETIGEWTEYSFYIKTEEGVTPSATFSISLGGNSTEEELWKSGYVFFDNFSAIEIDEASFITRKPVEGETEETIDESLIEDDLIKNNFRIVFTSENASAEEPTEEDTSTTDDTPSYLWLYITSGVIGGLIVIVVIVWLIKKFAPKRKFGTKKASYDKNKNAKNSERKNKYND